MPGLLASAFSIAVLSAAAAPPAVVDADHVSVALLSQSDALVPGTTATLGLRLRHAPHWHTYWINPGDSGLPTKLAWHLPEGFRAGDIAWPTPQRFTVGELYNFGYDGEVLLPVSIDVPASAAIGASPTLRVDAKWLVCQEQCVPGKATLTLQLPVKAKAGPNVGAIADFARAGAARPLLQTPAKARADVGKIVVTLPSVSTLDGLDAFAITPNVVSNAPPRVEAAGPGAVLTFAKSDYATNTPPQFDLLVVRPRGAATTARVTLDDTHP